MSARAHNRLLLTGCASRWHCSAYLERMHFMHIQTPPHMSRNEYVAVRIQELQRQRSRLLCRTVKETDGQFNVYCSKRHMCVSSPASCTRLHHCNTIADAQLQLGSILLEKVESIVEGKRKFRNNVKKTISLAEVMCVLREWWSGAEERILVPRDLHGIDDFPFFLISLIRGMSDHDSQHDLFQLNQNHHSISNNIYKKEVNRMKRFTRMTDDQILSEFENWVDDCCPSLWDYTVDDHSVTNHISNAELSYLTSSASAVDTTINNNNSKENSNSRSDERHVMQTSSNDVISNVEKQTMPFIQLMSMITSYIRYHCGVGWGASVPQKSKFTSTEQFEHALAHYYRHIYYLHPWHNVYCPTGWHEQEPFVHVLQWMRSSGTHNGKQQEKDSKFNYHGSTFSALDVSAQSGFGVDLLLKAGCSSVLAVDCVDSGVKNTQATTYEHIRERRSSTSVNISSSSSSSSMYGENDNKSIVQTELCELLPIPCKTVVSCVPSLRSHEQYYYEQNKLVDNNINISSHQNKNMPLLWKKAMENKNQNSAERTVQLKGNIFLQQRYQLFKEKESSEVTFTSAAKARRALARQQGRCINGLPDTLSVSSHRNHESDDPIECNNSSNSNDNDVERAMQLHKRINAPITGQTHQLETCTKQTETPESQLLMTESLCKFDKKTQSAVDVLYFHPPPSYVLPFSIVEELLPLSRRMQSSECAHENKSLSSWWNYVHHKASHEKQSECRKAKRDTINCIMNVSNECEQSKNENYHLGREVNRTNKLMEYKEVNKQTETFEHVANGDCANNEHDDDNDNGNLTLLSQSLVLPWLLCSPFARDHHHSNLWTVQRLVEELRKDVFSRSPRTHEIINHDIRNFNNNNVKQGSSNFCIERAYLHDNGYALFVIPRTFDLMELLRVTSERSVKQHKSSNKFCQENSLKEAKRELFEDEVYEQSKPFHKVKNSNVEKTFSENVTCISDWIIGELDGLYSVVDRKRFYNKSLEKRQLRSPNRNNNNQKNNTFRQKAWVEQLIQFMCTYCNTLGSTHLADADQLVEEFTTFCNNELWQDVLILRKNGSVAQRERTCTMQKMEQYKTLEVEDKMKCTQTILESNGNSHAHRGASQKQYNTNNYKTENRYSANNEFYNSKNNNDKDDDVDEERNMCAGIRWDESYEHENYKPRTVEAPSHLHWSDQLLSFSYLEQDYWPNKEERTLAKHNVFATGHPPNVQVNLEREKMLASIPDTSTQGAQNVSMSKYNRDIMNEGNHYKDVKAEAVQRAATAFKSVFAEELRTKRKGKLRKMAMASKATQEWLIDDKIMKSTASQVELLNQISRFDEKKYED